MTIGEVVEAQRLPVFKVEDHFGTRIMPAGLYTKKFFGLDRVGNLANLRRTNRHCCIDISVVINIHTCEDAWRVKAQFPRVVFGSDRLSVKVPNFPAGVPISHSPRPQSTNPEGYCPSKGVPAGRCGSSKVMNEGGT